ncbi:CASP2 and RIPK1 domain containing adaptor with death domain [Mytilus galloprovincialis]|uniref:CASP2 and RIPK1 domain containing adaptor with death domain n=1 Tax=Mytilus galloprovincialis TaxID=29158 RepID=A0A8B6GUH2_MYTGA|nr:CASP2 and RIPK1 domain containing adaptor with death domain [Mytilus galloprovincialis]
MPLTNDNKSKILKNFETIINELVIVDILDHMITKEIFTIDDSETINSKPTQKEKNRTFVTILIRSKPAGYKEFISSLRKDEKAYDSIADQIENTVLEEVEDEDETIEEWIGNRMPPGKENQYLQDVHLLYFSKAIAPAHLFAFGTCLGFGQADVDSIQYKHPRASDPACHDLLVKWRNKYGHGATVTRLMDVFFAAHQNAPESIYENIIWNALKKMKEVKT